MKIENIIVKIEKFRANNETEDYEITEFFEEIRKSIENLGTLTYSEKKKSIKSLFAFLKNQDSEMSENFSFIHLIEDIDNPEYSIYNTELLKFNTENGAITSTLLLNRHTNSLKGNEWEKCVELLKSISENRNYSEYIREFAKDFYKSQIERNHINANIKEKTIWSKLKKIWN